jgi:MFS family permease
MSAPPPAPDETRQRLPRQYWFLWCAATASNLADGMFKIIVPLVAVTLTRDPVLVAGVSVAASLPWLVFSLPIGALVDRMDRRKVMAAANTSRALLVAVLAVFAATDLVSIWALYAVALGTGIAEVFYDTSTQSILPQIVDKKLLPRANGLQYGAETVANMFAGQPLGGILMAVSVAFSLAVPAAIWGVGVGALLALRGSFRVPREDGPKTGLLADVAEGLRYLFGHGVLRTMAIMTGVSNLSSSAQGALLVLYAVGAESYLGLSDAQYGLLAIFPAVGGVLGAVLAEKVVARLGRSLCLALGVVLFSAAMAVPAVTFNIWIFGSVYAIMGFAISVWNVVVVSLRQAIVPPGLLGRLNSAYRLVAWGMIPLGSFLGGVLAKALGLLPVFVICGACCLALLALMPQVSNARIEAAEAEAAPETVEAAPDALDSGE